MKLNLHELVKKPVLRENCLFEWMTKLTEEEYKEWEEETRKDIESDVLVMNRDRNNQFYIMCDDNQMLYDLHSMNDSCDRMLEEEKSNSPILFDLNALSKNKTPTYSELKSLLKESRDLLILCSLIDKSGKCTELVDKIDNEMNWK